MSEHRCPSRYITDDDEMHECVRYIGHDKDGERIGGHVDQHSFYWSTANEYHEPPPPPEPQFPWRVIDKEGYGLRAALTRSEAEALCPGGGRAMKLVDADAQVVEPVSFATLMALATCDGPASVVHVLRSVGIEHTWNGYG